MPDSFYISLAYNFIWQNQAILLRNKHTHVELINLLFTFFSMERIKDLTDCQN